MPGRFIFDIQDPSHCRRLQTECMIPYLETCVAAARSHHIAEVIDIYVHASTS